MGQESKSVVRLSYAERESVEHLVTRGRVAKATRQRLVEEGLEATLHRKPSANRQYRKLDGAQEAHWVALACSAPPAGRVGWTRQLLADRLVELQVVDSISQEAVRTTLKKTRSNLGARSNGCCRPLPDRLAIHHRKRPHQTQTTRPINSARVRH